ncbi:MAG: histone deacetylase [Deltaproteobacteria bacterium]|nr:histone deacetylase [Deltaproteobacteria bacterium]
MSRTGIVRSDIFLGHDPGTWHPESPKRLETIHDFLDTAFFPGLRVLDPRPATREEITLIHGLDHYRKMAETAGKTQCFIDSDTQTSAGSFDAALAAAGGLIQLVEQVLNDELDNGFALIRPPGHHAEANRAMGFCLFNNIAIAAAWALEMRDLSRIMIVDWDLHHGNGTQRAFYDDPRVLYLSTHLFPFYPGSGGLSEVGVGEGKGYTINLPMGPKHGDQDFVAIFQKVVKPLLLSYKPELILVSAGFDTHAADPMGGMVVSPEGFAAMTYILKTAAEEVCQGRLVLTLEGGYNLAGQVDSVCKVMEVLTGATSAGQQLALCECPEPKVIGQIRQVIGDQWGL